MLQALDTNAVYSPIVGDNTYILPNKIEYTLPAWEMKIMMWTITVREVTPYKGGNSLQGR